MKALSIQQPWAWAILNCGKDIENRTWQTSIRGRILIHAGKRVDAEGIDFLEDLGIVVPSKFELGGIVGSVSIGDCVKHSTSKWFFGPFGFVLSDPETMPFRQMRGQLGFFEAG